MAFNDELIRKAGFIEQTPGVPGNTMARGLRSSVIPQMPSIRTEDTASGLRATDVVAGGPTPEQLEFMRRMDPKAMQPRMTAPATPVSAPPPGTDPLNLKQNLEQRMRTTSLEEPLYAARHGGRFHEDDEVLVGEEGPEIVRFNEPGTVIPTQLAQATPAPAQAPVVPRDMDTPEGRFIKREETKPEFEKPGFFERILAPKKPAPAPKPADKKGEAEGAPLLAGLTGAAALDRGRSAVQGLRSTVGNVAAQTPNALRSLARGTVGAGGLAFMGSGALDEIRATNQMAATPENRMERGLRILSGLNPLRAFRSGDIELPSGDSSLDRRGSQFGVPPQAAPVQAPAQTPVQAAPVQAPGQPPAPIVAIRNPDGSTSYTNVRQDTTDPRGTVREVTPAGSRGTVNTIPAEEFIRGGLPRGGDGFRGAPAALPVAPRGAFGSLAAIGAAGAASRVVQNQQRAETERERLGLSRDVAIANARRADADLALRGAQFGAAQREAGAKAREADIQSWAEQQAGATTEPGQLFGRNPVKPEQRRANIANKASEFRNEINFALGNRKDGRKLGDLSDTEMQQLVIGKKFKDGVNDARSGFSQSMRDYFGSKRFDSKDLYSYIPARVERSNTPGSSYKVIMKNGNTADITALAKGGFNWFGPNEAVDADMLAMITPLIDKFERGQKKR